MNDLKKLLDKVLAAKSSTLIFAGIVVLMIVSDWLG
jgi:hypothetical protein